MAAGDVEVMNGIFGAVAGGVLSAGGVFVHRFWMHRHQRTVRGFWEPFVGQPITAVVAEYPVDQTVLQGPYAKIAKAAGDGWLISKGMGLAFGVIQELANSVLGLPGSLPMKGSHTERIETDNVIVIGSEVVNPVADVVMRLVRERSALPFQLKWNEELQVVDLELGDGTVLRPHVVDGFGVDYGLVVKATVPSPDLQTFLLVAGCHMWGSYTAAKALASSRVLDRVGRLTGNASDVAFVVRTQVVNGAARGPELEFEGRTIAVGLPLPSSSSSSSPPGPPTDPMASSQSSSTS